MKHPIDRQAAKKGHQQDAEDLRKDQELAAHRDQPIDPPWYKCIGPGLVTGAADDDPSGIGTYSANGAQFGYMLLWLVPFCIPLMIAVQEMCGRVGAITGNGLAAVLKSHYPKWLLYSSIALLIGANLFNVYADLNVMAASAEMLWHVPFVVCLTAIAAVIVLLQILVPYRIYAKVLKWLCIALAGYVIVALLPAGKTDWGKVGSHLFVPHMDLKADTVLAIVAFLGTTISPYLFFWQAGETVEDVVAEGHANKPGHRTHKVTESEIRNIRADTAVGMIVSQLVALFIVVAAVGSLHDKGITDIKTAQDAAKALLPLGPAAYWIFTICMIGTGLLAIPTLAGSAAYAVAEAGGWRYGLYRRFTRAPGFYLTIVAMVGIGYGMNFVKAIDPIKGLVYSAALNGIVAPPLIVVLLLMCNNSKIVGKRTNGRWSNTLGVLTVLLMGPAAIYLVYMTLTGKA